VRIPAAVLEAAHLGLDQPVNVHEEGGRIVIEPLQPARYNLDALVAGITDENRQRPLETGRPVGRET
jgi:antitoxin MazE